MQTGIATTAQPRRRLRRILPLACLALLVLAGPWTAPSPWAQETAAQAQQIGPDPQTIRRLQAIRSSLQNKREEVQALLEQLRGADEAAKPALRAKVGELQQDIRGLSESFETTALDGLKLRALAEDEGAPLDWRDQMMQIAEPILQTLRNATERPRRISELQQAIEIYRYQLALAEQASASLQRFSGVELPPEVAAGIREVTQTWQSRNAEISRLLGDARDELQYLQSTETHLLEDMGGAAYDFILGRGLTLLLALIAAILLWYVTRRLRYLLGGRQASRAGAAQGANARLLLYAWHLLSVVLVTLAILSVFYLRGDVLLLSLAIVALVMLALGVWRFLPGYLREARLLLNAGSVRAGERVVYRGLPLRIESLNLHSELRNPELEGSLRLPLAILGELNSRPQQDEPWFPCRAGEFVLLPDGTLAEVLRQTIELVQLRVLGSTLQYDSAEFLRLGARNLSRDGFGLAVVFGIDYSHQQDAMGRVPDSIRGGLEKAFAESDFADALVDLMVEFKSAGASSLDYLVYASMAGSSASAYFRIGRLVQQTCVEVCNREGWIIPFAQLTVHQAAGGVAPAAIGTAQQPG